MIQKKTISKVLGMQVESFKIIMYATLEIITYATQAENSYMHKMSKKKQREKKRRHKTIIENLIL